MYESLLTSLVYNKMTIIRPPQSSKPACAVTRHASLASAAELRPRDRHTSVPITGTHTHTSTQRTHGCEHEHKHTYARLGHNVPQQLH